MITIIDPIIEGINSAVTKHWKCPDCGERGYVGIYVKCGAFGSKHWIGWWKK